MDYRRLSDDELNAAKSTLSERNLLQERKTQRIKSVEVKIRKAGSEFAEVLNPIQQEKPKAEKIIGVILIFYGALFFYLLLWKFGDIYMSFREIARGHFYTIPFLLSVFILAFGVYFFFKRKKIGWILMACFIAYLIVGSLNIFIDILTYSYSGALSNLFPKPSIISTITELIFVAASIFAICRKDVRLLFNVSKNMMVSTIVLAILSTILIKMEIGYL